MAQSTSFVMLEKHIVLHLAALPKLIINLMACMKYLQVVILTISLLMLLSQSSASHIRNQTNDDKNSFVANGHHGHTFQPSQHNLSASESANHFHSQISLTQFLHTNSSSHSHSLSILQVNLATKHYFYIKTYFPCNEPRPKLFEVTKFYPSKRTIPR